MRRAVLLAVVLLWVWAVFSAGRLAARTPPPRLAEAEIAYAEGLAAFHARRWEEAADWLAESERLNPQEGAPRYWRGLALLRLGRAQEAAGEIAASLAARHPPDVERGRLLADLEAARRAPAGEAVALEEPDELPSSRPIDDRGAWEGVVGLGITADSNPNLLSAELIVPRPDGKPGGLIRGGEGDALAWPEMHLGLYPFHDRPGPSLGVTFEARRSFHQDFGFLDLGEAHGALQLAFGDDPQGFLEGPLGTARVPFGSGRLSALLQAGGATYQLDGGAYLRTWEGAGALFFHERPTTATRLDLGYADRGFAASQLADERQSGKDLSLQASQLFFFGRPDRSARIGILGVDRRSHPAFTEKRLEANAELRAPFALRWTASLEGAFGRDDFAGSASNLFDLGGPARRDTTRRAALTLAWAATERLLVTARGTYANRSSNVDLGLGLPDLDYRQSTASLGVSWRF
jgi:hypothetical protein